MKNERVKKLSASEWEARVNESLDRDGIGLKVDGKSEAFCAAERARALAGYMLGGSTGYDVTLDQIRIFFATQLRYAQLYQLREVPTDEEVAIDAFTSMFLSPQERAAIRANYPFDAETYAQALHLDRPFGRRVAERYFKQLSRNTVTNLLNIKRIQEISETLDLPQPKLEDPTVDPTTELRRRLNSYQTALNVLQGRKRR